ncbi:uncharacterized protein G6M90_00g017710 [Metarhizium brunneum]|uniref:Uncharacterized protein n=1 Tax=Metarhizium brunneum TaxID=500148 RepID=A0A7D5UR93_9HYPO|nr:hypothetical protein G6M90_00g017710 [Metarhizium brunneum]
MKHIELILATFAGLAFAAPQRVLTAEEWVGDRVITQQRVLEEFRGRNIICDDEEENNRINCEIGFVSIGIEEKSHDGLSPLCEKKGGCKYCRIESGFRNAQHFMCAYKSSNKDEPIFFPVE